jgi:transposase-like protein
MPGKAAKIQYTEKQQSILKKLAGAATSLQCIAQRAQIILRAFDQMLNRDIAAEVGLHPDQVGMWRRRWQESYDALVAIECRESTATLTRAIEQVLSDAPRSGSPGTFTAEQVTQILATACEPPENSGRPIDNWTHRELADEVIQRGIVASISVRQVGRYLEQADLQPHRSKYWLNTKEKDPEVFEQQVQTVCQTYLEAPDLYFQENTYTVSVDEMPGIQALERIEKEIPMQPGQPARIEYEYKRHGTLCLIGNWDVVCGQMLAPTIGTTRTEKDLVAHFHQLIQTDPTAGWVIVLDNLNVHCSESLVRWVARREGIDESTLGRKGKSGILKSVASRREFLEDRGHRIRFVFTPKHSSWLNQIEIVFGIVYRRAVARASFSSLAALKERLLDFIEYFNRTFARPFRWTYTGRPVKSQAAPRPRTWRENWISSRQTTQTLAAIP